MQTLKRSPESDRIADEIRASIRRGELRAQDRVQSERALAGRFRVGVHAVRKALARLKAEGWLEARPRSGLYVATRHETDAGASVPLADGFHVMDVHPRGATVLVLAVSGWNAGNRAVWERICRAFSSQGSFVSVEPVFPASAQEWRRARRTADIFMTTPTELPLLADSTPGVFPISKAATARIALPDAYWACGSVAGGGVCGVPILGTLLTGVLDARAVSARERAALASAESWDDAFAILARAAKRSGRVGLNLGRWHTYNVVQHILHAVGPCHWPNRQTFEAVADRLASCLDVLAAYRGRAFAPGHASGRQAAYTPAETCAFLEYTYAFARHPVPGDWIPWAFPLGDAPAAYLEGVSVACISRQCPHPDAAEAFLCHLLSDGVQGAFAALRGDHPLSSRIADPFAGYPEPWRGVLQAMRRRSAPQHYQGCRDRVTFVLRDLNPLLQACFEGRATSSDVVDSLRRSIGPARRRNPRRETVPC